MTTAATPADYIAIRDVLARYCRGIDRMERALILDAYWPEAIDSHVYLHGPAVEFVDWVLPRLARERSTLHLLGQSTMRVDADSASVETYLLAHHVRASPDGDFLVNQAGRYLLPGE